ncbi:ATP synthase subunit F [Acidaminobacter sp. JC074]|uniref:V-type ATP synthase subunit F n=1 Tax=Acidaminobacter sp. JC074 TaxID=2530199 RepID=UPI001F116706|nr:V-type ATP synthase subunit F [Acidaminobacter sp. JC074]MCH4889380.1 ATP synthase subunit F [Acidaminobacter sp. JC074]
MESYLISDNEDTLLGLKMAGIEGQLMTDDDLIIKKIDELIDDPKIGIIILTHTIKVRIEDQVMARKLRAKDTLIVEVPGPKESIQSDFITRYIRESIGLKL